MHFNFLKDVAIYLKQTKHWGICYHQQLPTKHTGLTPGCFKDLSLPLPDNFPSFPDQPTGPNPVCLVDAAYANYLRKQQSTTGYAVILAGGAITWSSKTQSTTALSSIKAEFYAALLLKSVSLFAMSLNNCLGQPPTGPTIIYQDNEACINVINARHPTDHTRHIETPYFKIQDWKEQEVIKMICIHGIISNSDNLTKPLCWVLHSRHAHV